MLTFTLPVISIHLHHLHLITFQFIIHIIIYSQVITFIIKSYFFDIIKISVDFELNGILHFVLVVVLLGVPHDEVVVLKMDDVIYVIDGVSVHVFGVVVGDRFAGGDFVRSPWCKGRGTFTCKDGKYEY